MDIPCQMLVLLLAMPSCTNSNQEQRAQGCEGYPTRFCELLGFCLRPKDTAYSCCAIH